MHAGHCSCGDNGPVLMQATVLRIHPFDKASGLNCAPGYGRTCKCIPIPFALLYWTANSSSPLVQTRVKAKLKFAVWLILCVLQIVVATPGRLWELMQEGHAHLTDMSGLSFFVLDEADRMVQQGHFQVTTVHAPILLCFAHSTVLSILSVLLVLHDTAIICPSIAFDASLVPQLLKC